MPYARFDDRYDDHPKIRRAWRREPVAIAIHAMAITYCNRHESDGLIEADRIDEWLALAPLKPAQRARVLDALLAAPALLERVDDSAFLVHDFLDWNLSSAQRRALAEQGRRGGIAKAAGRGPRDRGPGPGGGETATENASEGYSEGQAMATALAKPPPSEGSSHPDSDGSSTPIHAYATPTPSQAESAHARVRRRVDQSKRPDGFPDSLVPAGAAALPILHRIWDVRGGIEPQPRGVGLAILRNPRADHVQVARELEHWLTAGKGQRARCEDIAKRFGDWVAEAPDAVTRATVTPIRRETASDWLREDFIDGVPIDAVIVESEGDVA